MNLRLQYNGTRWAQTRPPKMIRRPRRLSSRVAAQRVNGVLLGGAWLAQEYGEKGASLISVVVNPTDIRVSLVVF